MIQINLLPEEFRPVKKSILPYFLSLVVIIIGIVFFFSIYINLYRKTIKLEAQRTKLQQEYD
ncbi:MAG TPA: hypothetical protein PLX23_12140, partial [Candidatus Hydrogenedens sp.]|nr:hypothetical protein [Candidatus Hydrogenedens sp.]